MYNELEIKPLVEHPFKKTASPVPMLLSEKEAGFIRFIRELGFGQLTLYVEAKQPARAELIKQSVKF